LLILAMAWASVCLSVHPFVTLLYCVKMVQAGMDHKIFTVGCPKDSSLS